MVTVTEGAENMTSYRKKGDLDKLYNWFVKTDFLEIIGVTEKASKKYKKKGRG